MRMAGGSAHEVGAGAGADVEIELSVGNVAAGGGCVARDADGRVVFVRHTLPGERVRARITSTTSHYRRADAVEILEPSEDRVAPPCPYAGPDLCGGCDYQHISLGAQRRLKAFLVREQLQRVAAVDRDVTVEAVAGDTDGLGWRNRVRLAVDREGKVGFRKHRSHDLLEVEACAIAHPAVMATGAFKARWRSTNEIEVVAGDEEAVISVATGRKGGLSSMPSVAARVGMVVNRKVVHPPDAVHAVVSGHPFRISNGVFWQVHVGAAAALTEAVLGILEAGPGDSVVDLYAGAGLFSVPLAERVRPEGSVLAVERDGRACADARHNGQNLPQLRVTQASVSPVLMEHGIGRPDLLVLDPAREGAGTAVMAAVAAQHGGLRRLAYVSCDAGSFSRDVRVLLDAGWSMTSLRAFDIFPMTEHVELVAGLVPPGQA